METMALRGTFHTNDPNVYTLITLTVEGASEIMSGYSLRDSSGS
jgi:hypothetical protein